MSKNLIPEIAKMLGVEIGEEFKVEGVADKTYKFIIDDLIVCGEENTNHGYVTANMMFVSLAKGDAKLIKRPWKPKEEELYYTFTSTYKYTKWEIGLNCWHTEPQNLAFLKAGWVFRTRQEAEAALPAVAAEMGVEYEL